MDIGGRREQLKGYLYLAMVAGFVGYFGVWQLARFAVSSYGVLWAWLLAVPAGLGLLVIVVVGAVMIHCRVPGAAVPGEAERGPLDEGAGRGGRRNGSSKK